MPCLCSDFVTSDNLSDSLKIYFAPLDIHTKSSYTSNDHTILYNHHKFNYHFNQLPDYVNSRTFYSDGHNKLHVNGTIFILKEFHFHDHQENIINNDHNGVIELHFVYQEINNPINYAVLAFIFKLGSKSSKMIRKIKKNKNFKIPNIDNYFTYSGSLTKVNIVDIPQIAVNWNLSDKYLKISQSDLNIIRRDYCRQSSTVQPNNGRNIIYVKK
jgi:carbonic anhydrase